MVKLVPGIRAIKTLIKHKKATTAVLPVIKVIPRNLPRCLLKCSGAGEPRDGTVRDGGC